MELYVLDDQLRRVEVFDVFESLIWTERYSETGDFQFVLYSDQRARRLLTRDTNLAIDNSYRVMTIKNVENRSDTNGKTLLEVSGVSLESLMEDRVAKNNLDGLSENEEWVLEGTPANVAREIFKSICVDGDLDPLDIIPYISEGDFLPTPGSWAALDEDLYWDDATGDWATGYGGYISATPTESGDDPEIEVRLTPTTVYEAIKTICDQFDLGFRLIRNFDNSELYFDVYSGVDRTGLQTLVKPVIFSSDLDNLQGTTDFKSSSGSKNVAYVFAQNGAEIVYSPDADINSAGFRRKVLVVDASDVDMPAGSDLTAVLQGIGLRELSNFRDISAFDGEISQFGDYRYGVDYNLGDLVELRSSDFVTSRMRVTEQILVDDAEGERAYPTLTNISTIDPDSWDGQLSDYFWDDADGTWSDLGAPDDS